MFASAGYGCLRAGFALVILGAFTGCYSNLLVSKVPLAQRAENADKQQGFRYYLNRPYLVVKKPIFIAETITLVKVDPVLAAPPGETKMGALTPQDRVTFLDGPRRGESVQVADLRVGSPGSGLLRPLSSAELQKIAAVMAANAPEALAGLGKGKDAGASTVVFLQPVALEAGSGAEGNGKIVPVGGQLSFNEGSTVVLGGGSAAQQNLAGGGEGAAFASNTSDTSAELSLQSPTEPAAPAALQGDMDIIYLPDLDEQYVIKSCNLLAKSSVALAFKNGSELTEVQGQHDATTLTVALFKQIQQAIGVAQGVEQARIQQQQKQLQALQAGKGAGTKTSLNTANARDLRQQPIWQLVERTSIKPGVYRLNKPWEVTDGPGVHAIGCGLLAKLGLPTVVDVEFLPVNHVIKAP